LDRKERKERKEERKNDDESKYANDDIDNEERKYPEEELEPNDESESDTHDRDDDTPASEKKRREDLENIKQKEVEKNDDGPKSDNDIDETAVLEKYLDEEEDTDPPLKEDPEYHDYFEGLAYVKEIITRDGKDPFVMDLDPNKSLKSQRKKLENIKEKEAEKKRIEEEWLKKMKKRIDEEIAGGNKFVELTFGFIWKYFDTDRHGMRIGEEKSVFIDMATPRPCSYNKTYSMYDNVEETITIEAPSSYIPSSTLPVEYCGITLRQIRAVLANMERRCVEEGWTDRDGKLLTPEQVNFYHLNEYIIKLFTTEQKTSFVEALPTTTGPQLPRFFVNHWWGDLVRDSTACLERFVIDFQLNDNDEHDARGGGMSNDTPFWMCAYANNQWELGKDTTKDPKESVFTRAMVVANNRTITILDKEGVVFSRVWCLFELFLTRVDSKKENAEGKSKGGEWGIYTAHTHTYKTPWRGGREEERQAVGIISGGSTSDYINPHHCIAAAREAAFPYSLIKKSLSIQVESAEASSEADRIHILNSIVGTSTEMIDDEPPTSHDKYVELNDSLRDTFVSSAGSLRSAAEEGGEGWKEMLTALSKGNMQGEMTFNFESGEAYDRLTGVQATELINHLPLYLDELDIFSAQFGSEFVNVLIKRVKVFHNLNYLNISDIRVGGEEGGQEAGLRFAEMLSTNTTIKGFSLFRTDLITTDNMEKWGDALMQNNTMTELDLSGVKHEIIMRLKKKTENRTPELAINSY